MMETHIGKSQMKSLGTLILSIAFTSSAFASQESLHSNALQTVVNATKQANQMFNTRPGDAIPGTRGVPMPNLEQAAQDLLEEDIDREKNGIKGCEYKIFLSSSLTDQELWTWRQFANTESVPVDIVIRGLVTRRIPETMMWFEERMQSKTMREGVSASLDPESFREYHVDKVPAVGYRCGKESFVMYGAGASLREAEKLFKEGKRGAQSQAASETKAIAEVDLIDEMQARASKLDLDKKVRDSAMNYWSRQRPTAPHNEQSGKFRYKFEYILSADSQLEAVPLNKGDKLPESMIGNARCIRFDPIAIDATDPQHVLLGAEMVRRARMNGREPLVMSTVYADWGQLGQLANYYDVDRVFLLNQQAIDIFKISGVPTHVTQDKECAFLIKAYGPQEVNNVVAKLKEIKQ